MSIRTEKIKVKELLIHRDLEDFQNWVENARNPQRALLSLAYDDNELVQWKAVEAIGRVASIWTKSGTEKIRNLIRQQLWMINDESGGLGWHSPEIVGEILVNAPQLIDKYASLLTSYFNEEPFERGSHLAVYRVASVDPKPFADKVSKLMISLDNSDIHIQAYTILALGEIDSSQVKEVEDKFSTETKNIELYDFETGQFVSTNLRQIIKKVLDKK